VAHRLLCSTGVDRAVLATASELYAGRHYASVVSLTTAALIHEPDNIVLRLLRARSQMALRNELEAQTDLREVIRIDARCSLAYRLLGVLAARRDENESAAIFFEEALRLDPEDVEADTWLAIVRASAPAARRPRMAIGTRPPDQPDDNERTPVIERVVRVASPRPRGPTIPELAGFGEYLVEIGLLSRERLRAAQAYQRSMKVQLSAAIVALGLATPQRIEWAAVAHQSSVGRRSSR